MPGRKLSKHNPSQKILARLEKFHSGHTNFDRYRTSVSPRRKSHFHVHHEESSDIVKFSQNQSHSTPVYQPTYPPSIPQSKTPSSILSTKETQDNQEPSPDNQYTPFFEPVSGIPLGIEPLSNTGSLFVRREREPLSFLAGYKKSFSVFNDSGQRIFLVAELTKGKKEEKHAMFAINCNMYLQVFNGFGKIVMKFVREKTAGMCGSRQPNNDLVVTSTLSGQVFGFVQKDFTCCRPAYFITDNTGVDVMHIQSSHYCWSGCCGQVPFQLFYSSALSLPVGSCIKKQVVSGAVSFGMDFPSTLPESIKGTLLAALFNLYFSYFEDT